MLQSEETLVPDKLLIPVPCAVRLCMIELAVPLVQEVQLAVLYINYSL